MTMTKAAIFPPNSIIIIDGVEINFDQYLVIGVEDGWIRANRKIWREYLKAKDRLKVSTEDI